MKYKVLLLSIALLSCFTALFYVLSNTASAGVGCGTNWMGDTTGDTDFSVSKNQNLASSDSNAATTAATKPAVALGGTGAKAVQSAGIDSLTPNAASPQKPGTAIVWTASATGPGNEQLFYDFLLRGPATDGLQTDKTGWIERNSWTWNTTNADAGENQIEVRIKYASSKDAIASKTESFTISTTAESGAAAKDSGTASSETVSGVVQSTEEATATAADTTATAGEAHPVSKTAGAIGSKPRVSPDERTKVTSTEIIGPNMNMPDPSPKDQTTAGTVQSATQATPPVVTYAETESKVMEVDGKWSVRLVDAASSMDLILIQTGKSISGWGNLEEKNTKLPLIATGSVSDNSINLDVKTVVGEYVNKIDKRFKLDLVKVDRVVSGSYEAYSGEDLTGKGNATASRT